MQMLFPSEKSLGWILGISTDRPQHNELNFLDSKEEFTQELPCVRVLLYVIQYLTKYLQYLQSSAWQLTGLKSSLET